MKNQITEAEGFATRCRKNSLNIILWSLAFAGTMIIADKAVLYEWYSSAYLLATAIVINALTGIGLVWTYIRNLKALDDLQRKIQLDALAIAMGVALVGGFAYSLMVTSGFIVDEDVSDITLLMVVAYMIAVITGQMRYR